MSERRWSTSRCSSWSIWLLKYSESGDDVCGRSDTYNSSNRSTSSVISPRKQSGEEFCVIPRRSEQRQPRFTAIPSPTIARSPRKRTVIMIERVALKLLLRGLDVRTQQRKHRLRIIQKWKRGNT